MLVRRIARPLFASWFVSEGLDALRRPEPHVARTEACWQTLGGRLGLPATPTGSQVRALVRAHGAATVVAAAMLGLGKAPRTGALLLAALTVPLVVVNQPFGGSAAVVATASEAAEAAPARSRFGRPVGPTTTGRASAADRAVLRERFLRNLTMLGGALLAAVDREGRPGVGWRVGHARVDHAAARDARRAVTEATREARAAVREARRAA